MKPEIRKFLSYFEDVDNGICPSCSEKKGCIVLGTIVRTRYPLEVVYTCSECGFRLSITPRKCDELLKILVEEGRH